MCQVFIWRLKAELAGRLTIAGLRKPAQLLS